MGVKDKQKKRGTRGNRNFGWAGKPCETHKTSAHETGKLEGGERCCPGGRKKFGARRVGQHLGFSGQWDQKTVGGDALVMRGGGGKGRFLLQKARECNPRLEVRKAAKKVGLGGKPDVPKLVKKIVERGKKRKKSGRGALNLIRALPKQEKEQETGGSKRLEKNKPGRLKPHERKGAPGNEKKKKNP